MEKVRFGGRVVFSFVPSKSASRIPWGNDEAVGPERLLEGVLLM